MYRCDQQLWVPSAPIGEHPRPNGLWTCGIRDGSLSSFGAGIDNPSWNIRLLIIPHVQRSITSYQAILHESTNFCITTWDMKNGSKDWPFESLWALPRCVSSRVLFVGLPKWVEDSSWLIFGTSSAFASLYIASNRWDVGMEWRSCNEEPKCYHPSSVKLHRKRESICNLGACWDKPQ